MADLADAIDEAVRDLVKARFVNLTTNRAGGQPIERAVAEFRLGMEQIKAAVAPAKAAVQEVFGQ